MNEGAFSYSAEEPPVTTWPPSGPLVSPPPRHRQLRFWEGPVPSTNGHRQPAGWWWLGAEGGAGTTCLERISQVEGSAWGQDALRRWPQPTYHSAHGVVVVCRSRVTGLEWARDLARQHASDMTPRGTRLLGLVVVADAPGGLPKRLRDFERSVVGGYQRRWYVPWIPEWRLTGVEEELVVHPDVQRLLVELAASSKQQVQP